MILAHGLRVLSGIPETVTVSPFPNRSTFSYLGLPAAQKITHGRGIAIAGGLLVGVNWTASNDPRDPFVFASK